MLALADWNETLLVSACGAVDNGRFVEVEVVFVVEGGAIYDGQAGGGVVLMKSLVRIIERHALDDDVPHDVAAAAKFESVCRRRQNALSPQRLMPLRNAQQLETVTGNVAP